MNAEVQLRKTNSISGHMIDLGAGHTIAFYQRNGVCWVAEFRDGRGEFTYAGAWFRLYAGDPRSSQSRRAARRSATSLTPEMLDSIDRLHGASEARDDRMLAVPRRVAAALQRCWIGAVSRLGGGPSRKAVIGSSEKGTC